MVKLQFQALDKYVLAFFIIFTIVYFLESIGGFYMTTAVVSIEKQFQLPSKLSGTMVSAGDFAYIPVVVFVAYLGGKKNRAKWIGFGCILIAVANILISSSNFLFNEKFTNATSDLADSLELSSSSDSLYVNQNCSIFKNVLLFENKTIFGDYAQCGEGHFKANRLLITSPFAYCNQQINSKKIEHTLRSCKNDQMAHIGPTVVIFFGLLILGIGRTMPFALGLPLIDDNIKKNNLPVYFAGMFLIRMVGPILGFQIGTVLQKYYYRFEQPYGLTPVDPEWIGRWWMGFLIVGAALLLPSLALFFFPTPKAGSPLNFIDKNVRKNSKGHVIMPKGIKSKAADFFKTIGSVLRQPVYFGSLIGRICDVFAFKGFYVFLPKYIELQFGLPQYKISMYMQPVGIAAVAIGVFLGTVAMRVFKLEGRRAAGFVAVCSGVATFLSFVNVFIGCNSTMTALGQNLDSKISLNYSCMSDCGCAQMPMFPVCDTAGNVFYSPCHAGCPLTPNEIAKFVNPNSTVPGKVFHNCTCVETVDGQASRQFCSTEECDQMALVYFLFMALWWMIGSLGFTAESLIILRSVPPVHRSVSLGFTGFLVSLFATLPSPIFWGLIFDQFCIKWDQKCKNTKGYCSIYNATELRWWLHILYSSIKFTALLADIFVFYHAKGLKLAEEEKDIHNVDSASKIKLHSTEYPVQPLVKQKEMCVKNLK